MPTSTMKALRKMRPGRGANLESVPIPTPGPIEVLVRVRAASICGTDLHIYGWDRWSASRIKTPMTFGHEFCGHVEKVGSEVTSVKPGDFVSAEMHVNCGHCRPCRMGQPHVCQNVKIIGIDADGCFAEYVIIPVRNLWKIDPAIPERYAAILDPLGNAVHTVLAGEIAAQNVLITGAGPIGLMAITIARACGAAAVFDPAQGDVVERLREATDGAGVDVLLEMSGNPAAIHQGFQMLRQGGRASLLGIPSDPVTFDLVNDVIFKGATVQGVYGRKMFETWVQMTELLKHGRLNLDPLFHEHLPLEKFEQAFSLLESGQAGKILLYPHGVSA
jgi:threonine 3-dehydrogenase